MEGYNLYFGCAHTQFHTKKHTQFSRGYPDGADSWEEFIERAFQYGSDYLDFFPIIYYPAYTYYPTGDFMVESEGMKDEFPQEWEIIKRLSKKYNQPGTFVTYPGYEWTGNRRRWGDHNVIFCDESYAELDLSMDVKDLFSNLREKKAWAIPHHTAYRVGNRGKDWDIHDEKISPVAEIFSVHGSSEGIDTPYDLRPNASMSPRVSGGPIQDGLNRGLKFGIIASGDNASGFPGRWGNGLAAVWAKNLDREGVWEAVSSRRTYGITGDRILLDFFADDFPMGTEFSANGTVSIAGRVIGSDSLDRIELIRNGRVLDTLCHRGKWDFPDEGTIEIKLRVEFGWGPTPKKGIVFPKKSWDGFLEVMDGEVADVEKCFTRGGQKVASDTKRVNWNLTTGMNNNPYPNQDSQQALVFTLRGKPDSRVRIMSESVEYNATVKELCKGAYVIPHPEEARREVERKYGLTQYENQNQKEYANSYKTLMHKGVPEPGYTLTYQFQDNPPAGENYYYVRVSQNNGQMAWSSPVWIKA